MVTAGVVTIGCVTGLTVVVLGVFSVVVVGVTLDVAPGVVFGVVI